MPAVDAAKTQASRIDANPPPPPARCLHILVADDNPINQRLIIALLDSAGHTATVAANGRQAIEAMLRERFDSS